jgi:hypothetical protein
MYTHQCHNTKRTRTVVTKQNICTYHCHNTKHVHIPLSQYTTYTHNTNTIHVHVLLSQYKTCTHTTVTIQNMYTYHCHNTRHVHVPLSQYKIITKIWVTLISVTCFWFSRYSKQAVGRTVGLISLITLGGKAKSIMGIKNLDTSILCSAKSMFSFFSVFAPPK